MGSRLRLAGCKATKAKRPTGGTGRALANDAIVTLPTYTTTFSVQMTAQSERLSSRCKVEDNIADRWYVPPNALVNASRRHWKPATKPVLRVGNTIESVAIPGAALGRARFRVWFWVSAVTCH